MEDVHGQPWTWPKLCGVHPRSLRVRNAWTILYVAAVFRYQQVTMQQKMKAIDAAGRQKCVFDVSDFVVLVLFS